MSASKSKSTSKSNSKSTSSNDIRSNCNEEKLLKFSKKHYTYINQIFGDATVRQIIEEEYPTTWEFQLAKAGPEFGNSFHHTVKDRDTGEVVCSVMDEQQDLHKNVNDTLCQSYSLMNYFEIPISDDKKEKQMAMVQMYRDIINGTVENFEGIDFREILSNEILRVKKNNKLWRNFVSGRGHISMSPNTLFKNIEQTLDEWEEFGYWFFIGKGECPTHSTYSAEMKVQKARSNELSDERHEGHNMGLQDVDAKSKSKSKTRSKSQTIAKSKSRTRSKSQSRSSPISPPRMEYEEFPHSHSRTHTKSNSHITQQSRSKTKSISNSNTRKRSITPN
jgi:hypothetical protein